MHPILFALRGAGGERLIGTYGVLVALAVAVVSGLVIRASARAKMNVPLTCSALAIVTGGAFCGCWLTFAVVETLRTGSLEAVRAGGGLVFYGAVPGGLLGAWAAGRWLSLDWVRLLDLSVPALAAGHAIGRLGCFFGGCCYGEAGGGPLAIVYTDPMAAAAQAGPIGRHPVPLYEAAGLLGLGFLFALIAPRRPGTGERTVAYLAAYAVLRLAIEQLRGDAIRGVASGVSTSAAVSFSVLLVALAWFARQRALRTVA